MEKSKHGEAFILGAAIILGLAVLGYFGHGRRFI